MQRSCVFGVGADLEREVRPKDIGGVTWGWGEGGGWGEGYHDKAGAAWYPLDVIDGKRQAGNAS